MSAVAVAPERKRVHVPHRMDARCLDLPDVSVEPFGVFNISRLLEIKTSEYDIFMANAAQATTEDGVRAYNLLDPVNEVRGRRISCDDYYSLAFFLKVDLFRVQYYSVIPELGNHPVKASGLIALPSRQSPGSISVVVYHHGTVFSSLNTPFFINTFLSWEDRAAILQFAAQGYAVLMPDNFGLGASDKVPHNFLTKRSVQQSSYDFLQVSRRFMRKKGLSFEHVFLSGWSAGSYNTMARKCLFSIVFTFFQLMPSFSL